MKKCYVGAINLQTVEAQANAVISFTVYNQDGSENGTTGLAIPISNSTTLSNLRTDFQAQVKIDFSDNNITFVYLDDRGIL